MGPLRVAEKKQRANQILVKHSLFDKTICLDYGYSSFNNALFSRMSRNRMSMNWSGFASTTKRWSSGVLE